MGESSPMQLIPPKTKTPIDALRARLLTSHLKLPGKLPLIYSETKPMSIKLLTIFRLNKRLRS